MPPLVVLYNMSMPTRSATSVQHTPLRTLIVEDLLQHACPRAVPSHVALTPERIAFFRSVAEELVPNDVASGPPRSEPQPSTPTALRPSATAREGL